MAIYGYCRISTPKQSIERQERNILDYEPKATIIKEVYSGRTQARPKWQKLLSDLKEGDVIIFDSVSRMSRDAESGLQDYMNLFDRGIVLKFLKEPTIDTDNYKQAFRNSIASIGDEVADVFISAINTALLLLARRQIIQSFQNSQQEVDTLVERTKEGIATARKHGKQIGGVPGKKLNVKKAAPAKAVIIKHSKYFNGNLNNTECMRVARITRGTFYKYLHELLDEQEQQSKQTEEIVQKEK